MKYNFLIWIIISFVLLLIIRVLQYYKENWLKFCIIHSIFDLIILFNPISVFINIITAIVKNEVIIQWTSWLFIISLINTYIIYPISIGLYLYSKKIFFNKKKVIIWKLYPYIDILIIFLWIILSYIIL